MPVPYNTGKVKIGIDYVPDRRFEFSRDAERIQLMLIGPGPDEKPDRTVAVITAVCLTIIFTIAIFF